MTNFYARTCAANDASQTKFLENIRIVAQNPRTIDSDEQDRLLWEEPNKLPHTHTLFFAQADTLSEAAHIMANRYGELAFHANEPDITVARALGTSSLDHLDHVLDIAKAQPSPLEAARFVLENL